MLDSPVNSEKEDKLHFKEIYADSIYEILQENKYKIIDGKKYNNNFVFGIFGNYGTGKSSIINLLKKNYKKSECFIVETSIWGFSSIESIKKILIELDIQCNTKLNFKAKLNQNEEKIDLMRFEINYIKIILYLIFLIIFSMFLYNQLELELFKSIITPIITIFIFILSYRYGINLISKKITLAPFEISQYKNKLELFVNKYNNTKPILLIIDDLDRCDIQTTNKICKKLEILIKSKLNVKIILPFSLKNKENLKNLKKLVDTFIIVPNLSEFENYKILKEVNKND